MPPRIPPTLGNKVTTREINWYSMVLDAWGEDWAKPDTAYIMSDGSRWDFTDRTNRGIYNGGVFALDGLILDPISNYPDMAPVRLLLDGSRGVVGIDVHGYPSAGTSVANLLQDPSGRILLDGRSGALLMEY